MLARFSSAAFAFLIISSFFPVTLMAESDSSKYKVLANQESGLNVDTVENYLKKGDRFRKKGNLDMAIKEYKKARKLSNFLAPNYRDLNGAFRGIDARIPKEMNLKGRKALSLLSTANLKLAGIYRQQDDPVRAVPLLVEVVKLVTPTKPEGQKAYQALLELGFVETPFAGARD